MKAKHFGISVCEHGTVWVEALDAEGNVIAYGTFSASEAVAFSTAIIETVAQFEVDKTPSMRCEVLH